MLCEGTLAAGDGDIVIMSVNATTIRITQLDCDIYIEVCHSLSFNRNDFFRFLHLTCVV